MRRRLFALPLLILALSACGKSDSVTDPVTNLEQGSMSAKIDGTSWQAAIALTATYSNGLLAFAGTNNAFTIGMAVGIINGPGTFQIGGLGQVSNALVTAGTQSWHALSAVGSGTVTITSISATSASGTFSFTAPAVANSGATGSKVVTEGKFNLKF